MTQADAMTRFDEALRAANDWANAPDTLWIDDYEHARLMSYLHVPAWVPSPLAHWLGCRIFRRRVELYRLTRPCHALKD